MITAAAAGYVRPDMSKIESFVDPIGGEYKSHGIPPEVEAAKENLETRLRGLGVVFGSDAAQMTALNSTMPEPMPEPEDPLPEPGKEAVVPGPNRAIEILLEEVDEQHTAGELSEEVVKKTKKWENKESAPS